jgi:hypothetical protein
VSEYRSVLERAASNFAPLDLPLERVERGRDRRGRNRRIAAGFVGIAVFVPAVWIVTNGLSFDRSETPAATGPAESVPAPAPAAPDVVSQRTCSDGARSRLELTDTGDRIKLRFEVHQSPVGHEWRIHFRHKSHSFANSTAYGHAFFRGTRVASDSGVLVVQRSFPDWNREGPAHPDGVDGRAVDRQTGEVCKASAWYR